MTKFKKNKKIKKFWLNGHTFGFWSTQRLLASLYLPLDIPSLHMAYADGQCGDTGEEGKGKGRHFLATRLWQAFILEQALCTVSNPRVPAVPACSFPGYLGHRRYLNAHISLDLPWGKDLGLGPALPYTYLWFWSFSGHSLPYLC